MTGTVETLDNKVLRTGKDSLLYQICCYVSSKKQYMTKHIDFIGTRENYLLYQIFCYIRSPYIEFPL